MASKTIAVIACSTRSPRLNPFIAKYVDAVLATIPTPNISVEIVDIADQSLPLYDEPTIPALHPAADPTPHYDHQHTRAWSATVRRYDAFVFVTPQYNWSIPASLKNALDYLYHEWTRKPAGIVSYGSKGGGKAADHLRGILSGLRMAPMTTAAALSVPRTLMEDCLQHGRVSDGVVEAWRLAGEEENILRMFAELLLAIDDS